MAKRNNRNNQGSKPANAPAVDEGEPGNESAEQSTEEPGGLIGQPAGEGVLSAPPATGPASELTESTVGTTTQEDADKLDIEGVNEAAGDPALDQIGAEYVNEAEPAADEATERAIKTERAAYVEKQMLKAGWGKLSPPMGEACYCKGEQFACRMGHLVDAPEESKADPIGVLTNHVSSIVTGLDQQGLARIVFDNVAVTKEIMEASLTGTPELDMAFLKARPKQVLSDYVAGELSRDVKDQTEAALIAIILAAHDIS